MDERYGIEGGTSLRRHLADLRAAECFGDLPMPPLSSHVSDVTGEAVIKVGTGLTMILGANHQKPPKLKEGGIDWARVERIMIQRIEQADD